MNRDRTLFKCNYSHSKLLHHAVYARRLSYDCLCCFFFKSYAQRPAKTSWWWCCILPYNLLSGKINQTNRNYCWRWYGFISRFCSGKVLLILGLITSTIESTLITHFLFTSRIQFYSNIRNTGESSNSKVQQTLQIHDHFRLVWWILIFDINSCEWQ